MNMLIRATACLGLLCAVAATMAQDARDPRQLAREVAIADVHRHVQRWVPPALLKQQMDTHNVRWSGAVSAPFGPYDIEPYIQLLGPRYIATLGQMELSEVFERHGPEGLVNPQLDTYRSLLQRAEESLSSGRIKGLGELILNNKTTNPNVQFRRKVRIDAPPFDQMIALADRHRAFVQIHSEDDADSVEQIVSLARRYGNASFILSHCLFSSNVPLIRETLLASSNIYCELSARSRSHFATPDSERARNLTIYGEDFAKPEWISLIEEFPLRFMVGTDTYNAGINFERNIQEIRQGLLSRLKPSTIEAVAHQNAVRVMRLK